MSYIMLALTLILSSRHYIYVHCSFIYVFLSSIYDLNLLFLFSMTKITRGSNCCFV